MKKQNAYLSIATLCQMILIGSFSAAVTGYLKGDADNRLLVPSISLVMISSAP